MWTNSFVERKWLRVLLIGKIKRKYEKRDELGEFISTVLAAKGFWWKDIWDSLQVFLLFWKVMSTGHKAVFTILTYTEELWFNSNRVLWEFTRSVTIVLEATGEWKGILCDILFSRWYQERVNSWEVFMNFVLVDGKDFFESNEGTEGAFSCILDQKVTDGIFGDG